MPRDVGPERAHFGGEGGLITETTADGRVRYYWRCRHCSFILGGKVFPNAKARIHLSADKSLRNDIISKVCDKVGAADAAKFVAIVKEKNKEREAAKAKRKRENEIKRSNSYSSPAKQARLGFRSSLSDDDVDEAWARAFFGLDIATRKVDSDLFRIAMEASQHSKRT